MQRWIASGPTPPGAACLGTAFLDPAVEWKTKGNQKESILPILNQIEELREANLAANSLAKLASLAESDGI